MNKTLIVAKREFATRALKKKFLLITLFMPLIIAIFSGSVGFIMSYKGNSGTPILLVDPNKITRIYFRDKDDELSLANQFYDKKNAFGLAENYKAFLNIYHPKIFSNPKTIFRNLGGYLKFSKLDGRSYFQTIKDLDSRVLKVFAAVFYIFF